MSTATLISIGTVLKGPRFYRFVPTGADLAMAMESLLAEENLDSPSTPVEEVDVLMMESFHKTYCGPVDFSEEGVNALLSWDEQYAKQLVDRGMRGTASRLNITLDPNDPNPADTVEKLLSKFREGTLAESEANIT